MFGPNTDITTNIVTDFSHRDIHFINLYKELSNLMLDKAGLHRHKYDVLFMGGSGTLAIESVFWSVLHPIDVIGNEGLWHDKWLEFDRRQPKSKTNGTHKLYCQLETSNGKTFDDADCIVDGISSFPYYDIPKNTKIFVTTSNKQLGSLAGLSIIFIRKDFWNEMQSDAIFSYMNLARYKNYGFIGQTAFTSLFSRLNNKFIFRCPSRSFHKIDRNSELLIDIFGGEPSPVFVVPKTDIPIEIAIKYNLYGMNTDSKNYSIFTYTSDTYKYERFHKEFK